MSIPKQIPRQRDFSAGQIDEAAMRRDDTELVRAGGRQVTNKRILASGGLDQRPGRHAFWEETIPSRTDLIRIGAERTFFFTFAPGTLVIRDRVDSSIVFSVSGKGWGVPLNRISYAVVGEDVVIAYPLTVPQVARWAGGTSWSVTPFTPGVADSGKKHTIFRRLGYAGVTMDPSDYSGSITLTFSGSVGLTAAHVGKRMRYVNRQVTITAVASTTSATATVNERLFPSQALDVSVGVLEPYQLGDVVTGFTSGATGHVASLSSSASTVAAAVVNAGGTLYTAADVLTVVGGTFTTPATLTVSTVGGGGDITAVTVSNPGAYSVTPSDPVTVTGGTGSAATFNLTYGLATQVVGVVNHSMVKFSGSEVLVGPISSATITTATDVAPYASTVWDEEVMNDYQGWPGSVFADQSRLGFCDFPSVPGGVAWSAIDTYDNFEVGADPDDAIFEIMREKCRVRHVIPSDDEFVFTNVGVFYVPISEANPLRPGSVSFREVTSEAVGDVRPIRAPQGVVFVNDGGNRIIAIVPTGQTARPYITRDVSQYHSNLIATPLCLAVSTGGGDFPESYLYIVNLSGMVAVGRFEPAQQWVGFVQWDGEGQAQWISALSDEVVFTTRYVTNNVTRCLVETLGADAYLDGQILYNNAPTEMLPSGVLGPLWYMANGTATLMDGRRPMGTREVDFNGYLVPLEGDDLTSPTLATGFAWTEVFEPFVPHADSGRSLKQTMRRRKIAAIMVVAKHSTGFVVANRRVPPWRQGDNVNAEPELREETHKFRMLGRSYDPRVEHVKDIPGPCRLIEFTTDVTV